jgi:Fe-S oxidoreductase
MVTREEKDSTRGRARLLWEMLNGELHHEGWRSEAVHDALDLCLSCKGCKSDCPVNVDMATYKAEFLHQHYKGRLRPRAHYSMGWLPVWARLAVIAPGLINTAARAPYVSSVLKRIAGVAPQRDLPVFAPQRFTDWFRTHHPAQDSAGRPPVILWPDTFTNNFDPEIGKAAVAVLEAAGARVILPDADVCCGLTWISTGQLAVAKRVLGRTMNVLREHLRAGVPIVGLEPSCTAVFRNDAADLFPGNEDLARLQAQTMTLAEYLQRYRPDWRPPRIARRAIAQVHCHQHAIMTYVAEQELLAAAGVELDVLASGCCGLAGNFGFEDGHYDVSIAAAERVLLPAVRTADASTAVIADGFSCRTQIEQGCAGRHAVHLAELLATGLPVDPSDSQIGEPEHRRARSSAGDGTSVRWKAIATALMAAAAVIGARAPRRAS